MTLQSAQPCTALRPYVRAYAQRDTCKSTSAIIEPVPARLEQAMEFQFGDPYQVAFVDGPALTTPNVAVVGLQSHLRADIEVRAKSVSFVIFFQPLGLSQLFQVPVHLFANKNFDATTVLGAQISTLWNRLGEARSFSDRVVIMEQYLLGFTLSAKPADAMMAAASEMLQARGALRVAQLASRNGMSRSHFGRKFSAQLGVSPKQYSRVARFQTAVDAKIANPDRSWLEIAHSLSYFDQMHMVHDFRKLGGSSPDRLMARLETIRPPALASSEDLR